MTVLSRRTVLRGLGVSLSLPLLEAMLPSLDAAAAVAPRRMAFLYVPNGGNNASWFPKEAGKTFDLPATLAPLEPYRDQLLVLSGLTADKARPNGDGPGDHARAMSAWLTGAQARKTAGANIRSGVSADQLAAQSIGKATKFASLEIGCESGRQAGNCDSGYSCAYSSSISWRTESAPVAKETNPRLVFDRLFSASGKGDAASYKAAAYKRSLLDYVSEDAKSLKGRLGGSDLRKLDEYLDGVREIERRLERTETPTDSKAPAGAKAPASTPKDRGQHLRLMADMMALAFQADLTRICTFAFANEGSNRAYREIGVNEGHHELSHHGRKADKMEKIQKIDRYNVEALAYLLGKLKAIKEGSGTLLDNCMIAYGSANGDGDRHNHDNLPTLLLGKGGGSITTGRHLKFDKDTPIANLWLSMLDRMGAKAEKLGDSTGRLKDLG